MSFSSGNLISKIFPQCRALHFTQRPRHCALDEQKTDCSCPQNGHFTFSNHITSFIAFDGARNDGLQNLPIMLLY
nr:MAG TPA: hypothetical protein [Caudoviricetes sp.]